VLIRIELNTHLGHQDHNRTLRSIGLEGSARGIELFEKLAGAVLAAHDYQAGRKLRAHRYLCNRIAEACGSGGACVDSEEIFRSL